MKKEKVIEFLIATVLGIVSIGGSLILASLEQKEYQEKLDHINSSKWWMNRLGTVIVKILRVYPKSGKVVYTKYSRTGKDLGTCQMDFDRFMDTYKQYNKYYGNEVNY